MPSRPWIRLCQILLVTSLAGCGTTAGNKQQRISESRATAEDIRAAYQRINPANRVGVVIATLAEENLAAVGDIAVKEFQIGDPIVFIDVREKPLVSGRIINITENALHVRYPKATRGRREPRVGDLAVRVVSP